MTAYVFASPPPSLASYFKNLARLYPFPRPPDPAGEAGFVILDSGAFALSKQNRSIDEAHMVKLAAYYASHAGEKIIAIAPDMYLNAHRTWLNWQHWHGQDYPAVAPVLQCRRSKEIDSHALYAEAQKYAAFQDRIPRLAGCSFVAFSNPGLRASEAKSIRFTCDLIRKAFGRTIWLHNLGAGWDGHDASEWDALGCFDSIDSIAYVTDAERGYVWQPGAPSRLDHELSFEERCTHNARIASGSDLRDEQLNRGLR